MYTVAGREYALYQCVGWRRELVTAENDDLRALSELANPIFSISWQGNANARQLPQGFCEIADYCQLSLAAPVAG